MKYIPKMSLKGILLLLIGSFFVVLILPNSTHAAVLYLDNSTPTSSQSLGTYSSGGLFSYKIPTGTVTWANNTDQYFALYVTLVSQTVADILPGQASNGAGWTQNNTLNYFLPNNNASSVDATALRDYLNLQVGSSSWIVFDVNVNDMSVPSSYIYFADTGLSLYVWQSNSGDFGTSVLPVLHPLYGCVANVLSDAWSCTGSTPPAVNPTITFNYPVNGTTTPSFDNFWLGYSGLNSSTLYGTVLTYDWDGTLDSPVNSPATVSGYGQSLMYAGRFIPYQTFQGNNIFGNTRQVTAFASLYQVTGCGAVNLTDCPLIATSTSVFQQYILSYNDSYVLVEPSLPTSTINTATSSIGVSYTLPTSTNIQVQTTVDSSTQLCSKPVNLIDIGGGVLYALCGAFIPTQTYTSLVGTSINNFKTDFPFSAFFGITGAVQTAIGNASSASNLPLKVLGLNGSYITLGTITPTTDRDVLTTVGFSNAVGTVNACDGSCAQNKVDNLFGIFIMLIWLTAGLNAVRMITTFHY